MRTAYQLQNVDVTGDKNDILESLHSHYNDQLKFESNNGDSFIYTGTYSGTGEEIWCKVILEGDGAYRIISRRKYDESGDEPLIIDFSCQKPVDNEEVTMLQMYRYKEFMYNGDGEFTLGIIHTWEAEEFHLNIEEEDDGKFDSDKYLNYVDNWVYRGSGEIADDTITLEGSVHSKQKPRVHAEETFSSDETYYSIDLREDYPDYLEGYQLLESGYMQDEFVDAISHFTYDDTPYLQIRDGSSFSENDFFLISSVGSWDHDENELDYNNYIGHGEVSITEGGDEKLMLFLWGELDDESPLAGPVYLYKLKAVDAFLPGEDDDTLDSIKFKGDRFSFSYTNETVSID